MVKAMNSSSGSSALVVEWMPPELRQRNGLITGYIMILTNLESSDQLTYNVEVLNVHVEGEIILPYSVHVYNKEKNNKRNSVN